MIVYYTSCSALNNSMAQFYVYSMFASTWGRAAAADGGSRKHKDGGEGRRSTKTLDKQ